MPASEHRDDLDGREGLGREGGDEVGHLRPEVGAHHKMQPERRRDVTTGGRATSAQSLALSSMFIPTCNMYAPSNDSASYGSASALARSQRTRSSRPTIASSRFASCR